MITLCYSGNSKIFKGLTLSVMSVVKHCKEPLEVIVLSMDVPEQNKNFTIFSKEQMDFLDGILKKANKESHVKLIDCTALYKDLLQKGKNAQSGYTPYALLRLLLDLLPNIPDKLIYIDMDTMCTNNIKELYDVDISSYELGAVKDYMGHIFIKSSYFNSGILLLNMKMIRETGLFEKSREMVNRKKMIMPDQSAINKYVKKRLFLNRRFNEQRKIKDDTVIKHFCKGIKFYPLFLYIYNFKQWEIEKVHKNKIYNFDDIYEEYQKFDLPK